MRKNERNVKFDIARERPLGFFYRYGLSGHMAINNNNTTMTRRTGTGRIFKHVLLLLALIFGFAVIQIKNDSFYITDNSKVRASLCAFKSITPHSMVLV